MYARRGLCVCVTRDGILAKELTDEDESHVLIHSLRDANLPKFLAEDVPLFESILDDLFPGVTPPELDQGSLEVRDTGFIRSLRVSERQFTKDEINVPIALSAFRDNERQ